MTYRELEAKIADIIPSAAFEFDLDGQIVIYTGLAIDETTHQLIDFELPED